MTKGSQIAFDTSRTRDLASLPIPDDMKHLVNYDERVIWALRGSDTVVVTDQRIIIRKTANLGIKKSFVDYPYSNMVNIKLDRGLRRASVEILMRSGVQNIRIGSLTKNDAYQLHRVIRDNIVKGSTTASPQPQPVIIQAPRENSDQPKLDERSCQKCGHKVSEDFAICPFCRFPLKIECPECGKRVDTKFKSCPYCAEDLSYAPHMDPEDF
jgi:RNA polymerase subunit RPABC4/transcription elongation factor Spt4